MYYLVKFKGLSFRFQNRNDAMEFATIAKGAYAPAASNDDCDVVIVVCKKEREV